MAVAARIRQKPTRLAVQQRRILDVARSNDLALHPVAGRSVVDVPIVPGHLHGNIDMSSASTASERTSSVLRVREGFTLPPDVLSYLADTSVDALAGQGTTYRNACRSLSELTRLVGEVLRRARARSRAAAQPPVPGSRPAEPRTKAEP